MEPNEICVIQQGIRFSVAVEGPTRGYILEVEYQSVWIWKLSTHTGIKTFHQRCTMIILSFPIWDPLEQTDLPIQGLHTNIRKKLDKYKIKSSYKALFRVCRTWTPNLRDFLTPTAWFEERAADFTIISKYQVKTYQRLWIHWQSGLVMISLINWYKATKWSGASFPSKTRPLAFWRCCLAWELCSVQGCYSTNLVN